MFSYVLAWSAVLAFDLQLLSPFEQVAGIALHLSGAAGFAHFLSPSLMEVDFASFG